ncbi:MAG: hypothetical protein CMM56_00345 [Rhodospirillaceae bacterium]|nr:hypothetical protein [Rhodospirillaceae bacterium]|tara:strand:- start:614 stop:1138 length:525 start_codon:yes stop_codon:yes gene_type:complete
MPRKPGTPRIRPKPKRPESVDTLNVYREILVLIHLFAGQQKRLLRTKEFSYSQGQVLQALVLDGPKTASGLARQLCISRQASQQTINQLVERALVRKSDNPAHHRSPLIELTSLGERTLQQAAQRCSDITALHPVLTEANLRITYNVLDALHSEGKLISTAPIYSYHSGRVPNT